MSRFRATEWQSTAGGAIDLMDALDLPRDVLGGYDWGGRAPASSLRSGVGEC